MSELLQLPRPVLTTATSFPPDEANRQLRHGLSSFAPTHPLLHHHLTTRIDAVELKHLLRHIDPEWLYSSLWLLPLTLVMV